MAERGDLLSQLRTTLGRVEIALSAVDDAIVWTDVTGAIQWCNSPFDRLIGRRHIEVLGARLMDVLPLEQDDYLLPAEAHPASVIFNTRSNLANRYEFQRAGERLALEISGTWTQFGAQDAAAVLVIRDITQRERTENLLAQQAAQLEAVNKELEAFSYSVSHDLRAPLRAIAGFSGILVEEHARQLDAEGQRLLAVILTNAKQMGQIINDLLAFSRLGRQPMVVSEIDMGALVQAVLEELKPTAAERRLRVTVSPLPPARGDKALMHQVWINLLSNAVKFTRPRDTAVIDIGARSTATEVVYYVKDNGVGFDMQYADKLFGVFQRLHNSEEFEGTGVGLSLVQRLVNRHGGRVWAEGAVNGGATFYFSLPTGGQP